MKKKVIEILSKKKTLLFLIMCLMVHAFNAGLFYWLKLFPFTYLNIFSTIFYAVVLLGFKKHTEFYMVFTYFEIVTFSFISELFSGGVFCYIFYVIGMVAVVFYLLPSKQRMKHVFQGVGIIYAIAIYFIRLKTICLFPQFLSVIDSCKDEIGFLNLCITLFTLFYISNLYMVELNAASAKLKYFSNHDLLTGLFNRRFFEYIMKRNKSENENEYTIAIFDIDDFKKVNDTYGHQAGDCVIKMVSHTLEKTVKDEYVPVRWGGEEFILYMPQTSSNQAYEKLKDLSQKIHNTIVEFNDLKINISVTVGMYTSTSLTDYENAIREADDKLYYGKRHGKNCVVR